MGLTAITGNVGVGKTLSLVEIAYDYHKKGHVIYSNIHLNFPYNHINTIKELDNIRGELHKPAILAWDEMWRWIDSRKWKAQKNDNITKLVLYSRHRNIKIYYTTQNLHQVEKRIRDITNVAIEPHLSKYGHAIISGRRIVIPRLCTTMFYDVMPRPGQGNLQSKRPFSVHKFWTPYIMTLYDTREEVADL